MVLAAGCGGAEPGARTPTEAASPGQSASTDTAKDPSKPAAQGAEREDPQQWLDQLRTTSTREVAVKRLIQLYEDAKTQDGGDREGEHVRPLLAAIVPPLAQLAAGGELDKATQGPLLSMLADTRDRRAQAALIRALDGYVIDGEPAGQYDNAIRLAVEALGATKATEAGPAALKLFRQMHASSAKAQDHRFYLTLAAALEPLCEPSWAPELIGMLGVPIQTLDKDKTAAVIDQVYWQATAAKLLGSLRSEKGVRPLVRVVLSPLKRNVHTTAISALIKIGKPAGVVAGKLLSGGDRELSDYAAAEYIRGQQDQGAALTADMSMRAKSAHQQAAVIILSNLGRAEGSAPLLAALRKSDAATKAIIASELHKLPPDPALTAAFRKVWSSTELALEIPQGHAKEVVTASAANFFDPDLAVWVANQAIALRGEQAPYVQAAALAMLMKVARKSDLKTVEILAQKPINDPQQGTVGKLYQQELTALRQALGECGDSADCWEKKLTVSATRKGPQQFVAIKAVYMLAMLGGAGARARLTAAIPKIEDDAVLFVLALALDRLSPQGDPALAAQLRALIEAAHNVGDAPKLKRYEVFKTVIYRLQARAD